MECMIALSLFSMVLSIAMSVYLSGYKMYRRMEYQTEVEENIRVVLNRISETLRRTDNLPQNVSVQNQMLYIGNARYYYLSGRINERIGTGTNNLGQRIASFTPVLENGFLTIKIEGMSYQDEPPLIVEQVFYIGGE